MVEFTEVLGYQFWAVELAYPGTERLKIAPRTATYVRRPALRKVVGSCARGIYIGAG